MENQNCAGLGEEDRIRILHTVPRVRRQRLVPIAVLARMVGDWAHRVGGTRMCWFMRHGI